MLLFPPNMLRTVVWQAQWVAPPSLTNESLVIYKASSSRTGGVSPCIAPVSAHSKRNKPAQTFLRGDCYPISELNE